MLTGRTAVVRVLRIFGLLFPLFRFVEPLSAQEHDGTLRILCYNIHHGEGADGRLDLARQAAVIRSCDPDLVALQEVDDRTMRTGQVDQTAELAKQTGLYGRFVHQLDFEGGRYGQAVLSKYPLSEVTVHWLPGMPDRERRVAGAVSVQIDNCRLLFVTTHLHHNNAEFRRAQTVRLNEIFASEVESVDTFVILAGDLNATPESQPIRILAGQWQSATEGLSDTLTFPADKPERQLDYIFLHPPSRVRVKSVKVLDEPLASDHRPLLAEVSETH
ncbi:MAG: endonuclease/exonuclease/phosphatase family protein [Planctomycetaceae bacterium]